MSGCLVNITCPSCETEIQIDTDRIHLERHPDWTALNRLVYTCLACHRPQRHDLTEAQWNVLLRLAGDLLRRITLPEGLLARFTTGPAPLTDDDLINFGRELYADDGSAI